MDAATSGILVALATGFVSGSTNRIKTMFPRIPKRFIPAVALALSLAFTAIGAAYMQIILSAQSGAGLVLAAFSIWFAATGLHETEKKPGA